MKSNHHLQLSLLAVLLTCSSLSLWAEDWKTTDGKTYQNVKVIATQPDAVTILHRNGGALVPLANLPPDLQKRFHYDPDKATIAAAARTKSNAENAKALQTEMNLASQQRQAGEETDAADGAETSSSQTVQKTTSAPTASSGNASHHSMDELFSSMQSVQSDTSDGTHHTIDDLSASSQTLRRDLSDPTYHTMAHLVYTVNKDGLHSDPADPNHHTISEVTNSGLDSDGQH